MVSKIKLGKKEKKYTPHVKDNFGHFPRLRKRAKARYKRQFAREISLFHVHSSFTFKRKTYIQIINQNG